MEKEKSEREREQDILYTSAPMHYIHHLEVAYSYNDIV